jgi:hypothetical protein
LVESNQPTGTPLAGVNGQMSGQHSYDWTYPDNIVTNAINRGLQVYVQIYWTAAWANGNPYPSCDPVAASTAGQCYVSGVPVGNPQGYPPMATLNVGGTNVPPHWRCRISLTTWRPGILSELFRPHQ